MNGFDLLTHALADEYTSHDRATIARLARPERPETAPVVTMRHDPMDGARPFGWTVADEIEVKQ